MQNMSSDDFLEDLESEDFSHEAPGTKMPRLGALLIAPTFSNINDRLLFPFLFLVLQSYRLTTKLDLR